MGGYSIYKKTIQLAFTPAETHVHVINAHVEELSLQGERDCGREAER